MTGAFVFVLLAVLIVSIIFIAKKSNIEGLTIVPGYGGYGGYYGGYRRYCSNCGYLGRRRCNKCVNCGFCVNEDGYGECVPGDNSGPYFRRDCIHWEYGLNSHPRFGYYPWYARRGNQRYRRFQRNRRYRA